MKRAPGTMWIWAMADPDLATIWTVLQTEASPAGGVEASGTGIRLRAGEVLAGADALGRRHLLVPLRPGEAFAEDRSGRSVHLLRLDHAGTRYLSAVCLNLDLDGVFTQFANELLSDLADAASGARAAVDALERWRQLFSGADESGRLGEPLLVGLLGELLVLETLLTRDDRRCLDVWTGPEGHQHDFRAGDRALEVKSTVIREGRVVSISSIDQLEPPPIGSLHLVHFRFEAAPDGDSLPAAIRRIRKLGIELGLFHSMLHSVGYLAPHEKHYERRTYRVVDRRAYDVEGPSFPRITQASFLHGGVPAGVLRISYSIDLSNEPPDPLSDDEYETVLTAIATA